jgi:hypothetical protein
MPVSSADRAGETGICVLRGAVLAAGDAWMARVARNQLYRVKAAVPGDGVAGNFSAFVDRDRLDDLEPGRSELGEGHGPESVTAEPF